MFSPAVNNYFDKSDKLEIQEIFKRIYHPIIKEFCSAQNEKDTVWTKSTAG